MKKIAQLLAALFLIMNNALSQTYKFDNNHQITEIKYDNGPTITIQYDANGNRTGYFVSAGGALPVQLLYFTAQKSGNEVMLTWATSEEVNTDKFEIEHSKDGNNFSSFVTVPAKGNSSVRSDYTSIHCCPVEGMNYYRLKMIDKDGNFKYSVIRTVVFEFTNVMKLYPNPVSDKSVMNVSFVKPFTKDASIVIYNSSGAQMFNSYIPKGNTLVQLNTEVFAAGRYNVVVSVDGVRYKAAFIKQ